MIYVDEIQQYPWSKIASSARRYGQLWCHLATDGDAEELHVFAQSIGCQHQWFQAHDIVDHYDLTPMMQERAIRAGAIPITALELYKKCRKRRIEEIESEVEE